MCVMTHLDSLQILYLSHMLIYAVLHVSCSVCHVTYVMLGVSSDACRPTLVILRHLSSYVTCHHTSLLLTGRDAVTVQPAEGGVEREEAMHACRKTRR